MPSSPYLAEMRPAYGTGTLADVMPTALGALGIPAKGLNLRDTEFDGVRRVAVLLLDGFGHHLLGQAAQASATIGAIHHGELGTLTPITATVPSSTPISLASLACGMPPGEHGIIGFTVRVPGTGDLVTHIRWDGAPDPETWQPEPTCFEQADADGVVCTVVSSGAFRDTGLTHAIYRGADWLPASTPGEVAEGTLAALARGGRSLVYGYLPDVDTAGHFHGIGSPQWLEAVANVAEAIDGILTGLPSDAALMVTADHGMVNVTDRLHVDQRPDLRDGVEAIAGDGRIRYLYTAPGAVEEVRQAWTEAVGGRAEVMGRDEAVDRGWFGPKVTARSRERIGDLVVACRDTFAVVGVEGEPPHVAKLIGQHGGLTAAEMAVPLWSYRTG
ncbi:alkaline phosphatase family protein [Glycomyces sp. TRM65418]|uniref:alkaline phosphatase family protein n=1 Tax=Glycomyces sp. TRM65418 TaxID=2867006 RepID=UPI001CE6BD99|nr:nucleotide pyrophosphatase/phosphodiesterase family protein [Glycomyces sp. TRM65418]MCC3761986.1 alkaline phosphatase family protein [Glycomyces sp. TRM65418]QZD56061.1 alkaline phosphatase family protein [Glycomyces sp. TRM65418]